MRPWDYVDSEEVPDDDGTIYLMSRGSQYAIHVNGQELMDNRMHGSEDAHADLACESLADLENAKILVGGLGMGFTLAAALRQIGAGGQVTVAELIPAVVRWNREYVGRAAGHPLRDERVNVYVGDVGDLVEVPPTLWSAILLDVDNGPKSLTRPTNSWLYSHRGLRAAHDALIPGGVLGIWSAATDDALTERLLDTGFDVDELMYSEAGRPTHPDFDFHVLWTARKRPSVAPPSVAPQCP